MTPISVPELSRSLRTLHGALLDAILDEHASVYGRTDDAFARLRLVREDPLFAWMKPLTDALVELDEALDADAQEAPARLPDAVTTVEKLVAGADQDFAALYRHYLRTHPEVAIAHGAVRGKLELARA